MKYPVEKQISCTLEHCKWLGYYYDSLVQFPNYSNAKNYDQIKGLYSIKNNMPIKHLKVEFYPHFDKESPTNK